MSSPRRESRAGASVELRLGFLEDDVDGVDVKLDKVNAALSKLLWAVMGLLFTIVGGLAVAVVTLGGGR